MKTQGGLSDAYRGDDVIVVIERCEWIQVDQHQWYYDIVVAAPAIEETKTNCSENI
jgi:hypothetical protein